LKSKTEKNHYSGRIIAALDSSLHVLHIVTVLRGNKLLNTRIYIWLFAFHQTVRRDATN